MYRVTRLLANTLVIKQMLASMAPAIVTKRQPYLLTKILAMGPVKRSHNIDIRYLDHNEHFSRRNISQG